MNNIYQKLLQVQKEAHAPREVDGRFGKGRSAEQILEAYKVVCNKNGLYLYTTDEVQNIGDRNYVIATATVVNVENSETVSAKAQAWENTPTGGLDTSQVTGKTSSYAKKYALQNLFAIDDTKDADNEESTPQATTEPNKAIVKTEPKATDKQIELIKNISKQKNISEGSIVKTYGSLKELDISTAKVIIERLIKAEAKPKTEPKVDQDAPITVDDINEVMDEPLDN